MRIRAADVIDATMAITGLDHADFYSVNGPRRYARARQVAMYSIRHLCPHMSYPEIARRLGRVDHTTAVYGVSRIEALRDTDAAVAGLVESVMARFGRTPPPPKSAAAFASLCRDYEARFQAMRLAA